MYQAVNYEIPRTAEECAQLLRKGRRNQLLAGTMFVRMSSAQIPTAIDLSGCGLDYLRQDADGTVRIGAMCTLRGLETSPILTSYAGGCISRAAGEVVGVQFRNLATVGASVFSKYGFSDIIPPLLACGAQVSLYFQGTLSLEEFLLQPRCRDLLTEIILPAGIRAGGFSSLRKSMSDFSILNAAAAQTADGIRIAVGARPACAVPAHRAMELVRGAALTDELIDRAAAAAAEELSFGSNIRGSAEYRRAICKVLTARALEQVRGGIV